MLYAGWFGNIVPRYIRGDSFIDFSRNNVMLKFFYHVVRWHLTICILCLKLGQFAMPESCENWSNIVNSLIYYAGQAREIYQLLPYSVDFKAHREF